MPLSLHQQDGAQLLQNAVIPGYLNPLGYQQFALSNVGSTALNPPAGAYFALIQAEADPIRWTDSGAAPTPTVGYLIPVGMQLAYNGDLTKIQLLAQLLGALANVTYYG
jgi:hypothetical protein